jgi:hypothetical protein
MERLTKDERERALWVVPRIAVLRGKGGYSEQEIAEKAGFNSVEHMQQQCKRWGLPAWLSGVTTDQSRRKPGPGTAERRELPPAVGAYKLFQERLEALLRDAESLASRVVSYQDKRFPGADVYPDTQAFFRYLPDRDGRRPEIFSEKEWQELCEQYDQPSDVEHFIIPDCIYQVPTEAAATPPEPLPTLIGVYALAGGEIDALLKILYPGEPSNEVLEEVRKCVEGKKKSDKKDGLKTLARQLATLVYGGDIQGAPRPALSSVEHDAACHITRLREEGRSEVEILQRLSNHTNADGSKLTKADIDRLGLLRLKYPQG